MRVRAVSDLEGPGGESEALSTVRMECDCRDGGTLITQVLREQEEQFSGAAAGPEIGAWVLVDLSLVCNGLGDFPCALAALGSERA